MVIILVLIASGIIASNYFYYLKKTKSTVKEFLITTLNFIYMIILCTAIIGFVRGHGNTSYIMMTYTINNMIKYIFMVGVLTVVLPYISINMIKIWQKMRRGKES